MAKSKKCEEKKSEGAAAAAQAIDISKQQAAQTLSVIESSQETSDGSVTDVAAGVDVQSLKKRALKKIPKVEKAHFKTSSGDNTEIMHVKSWRSGQTRLNQGDLVLLLKTLECWRADTVEKDLSVSTMKHELKVVHGVKMTEHVTGNECYVSLDELLETAKELSDAYAQMRSE